MKKFPFSILNSNELYTASNRIIDASKGSLGSDPYTSTLCLHIGQGNKDLAKALGKALNSEFTPLLLVSDQERDDDFISLRDYTSSFIHGKNPIQAAAGRSIMSIIDNVGKSIYNLGYAEETSKMNTLIEALETPSAQQALATIGATERFEALKSSQDEFEKTYQIKIKTESDINYPLVKDSKSRITKYLKTLLYYIDTNSDLDGAVYGAAKEAINQIITDTVAIAHSRATRIENAEDKEDKPTV